MWVIVVRVDESANREVAPQISNVPTSSFAVTTESERERRERRRRGAERSNEIPFLLTRSLPGSHIGAVHTSETPLGCVCRVVLCPQIYAARCRTVR